MKKKLIIAINMFIYTTYIIIISIPNIFGMDDIEANTYIFKPSNTILSNINHIIDRFINWNCRIGEALYFILGNFPRFITFIIAGIGLIIFLNLVIIYTYGSKFKEYVFTKKYIITLLLLYIITITIYPAFSESFVWMAGSFNHITSIIILLIAALPFRLLLQNIDIINTKKRRRIFIIFSILAAFCLENLVPFLLIYEITIIIYKRKNYNKEKILNLLKNTISTTISYILVILLSINRIKKLQIQEWAINSKNKIIHEILLQYKYIIVFIILLLIINIVLHKKELKNLIKNNLSPLYLLFLSIGSILIIYISPMYFCMRMTLSLFFVLLIMITLLSNLLIPKRFNILIIIFEILLIITLTTRTVIIYNDFNKYNIIKRNYIFYQYKKGNKKIICPSYDNKYNYHIPKTLLSYEAMFCDENYLKYLLNDNTITMKPKNTKIRN